jgi:hypothetical protein
MSDERLPGGSSHMQYSTRKGTIESWYHREARRAKIGKMQTVLIKCINRSDLPSKMFLRVLLARLGPSAGYPRQHGRRETVCRAYFGGFANLLSNRLPLVGVVLFDSGQQGCALFLFGQHVSLREFPDAQSARRDPPRLPRTRHSACPARSWSAKGQYMWTAVGLPCTSAS